MKGKKKEKTERKNKCSIKRVELSTWEKWKGKIKGRKNWYFIKRVDLNMTSQFSGSLVIQHWQKEIFLLLAILCQVSIDKNLLVYLL